MCKVAKEMKEESGRERGRKKGAGEFFLSSSVSPQKAATGAGEPARKKGRTRGEGGKGKRETGKQSRWNDLPSLALELGSIGFALAENEKAARKGGGGATAISSTV